MSKFLLGDNIFGIELPTMKEQEKKELNDLGGNIINVIHDDFFEFSNKRIRGNILLKFNLYNKSITEKQRLIFFVLLLFYPCCGNPIDIVLGYDPIKEAIEILDNAIKVIKEESQSWQSTLVDVQGKLTKDLQSTIKNEVSETLNRAIASSGVEMRCNYDFVRDRVVEDLIRLKINLQNKLRSKHNQIPVPKRKPKICVSNPSKIDRSIIPNRLNSMSLFGYNFDSGEFVLLLKSGQREVNISKHLYVVTHYEMVINLGENGVKFGPNSDSLIVKWQSKKMAEIPIIQPVEEMVGVKITFEELYVIDDADNDGKGDFYWDFGINFKGESYSISKGNDVGIGSGSRKKLGCSWNTVLKLDYRNPSAKISVYGNLMEEDNFLSGPNDPFKPNIDKTLKIHKNYEGYSSKHVFKERGGGHAILYYDVKTVKLPNDDFPKFQTDLYYKLVSVLDPQKVVQFKNEKRGGNVNVSLWNNSDSQKFRFVLCGKNTYRMITKNKDYVLDVSSGSKKNGANIHLWNWKRLENQMWRMESLSEGVFKIISEKSEKVLSVSNEDNLYQWEWLGYASQKWKIVPCN